MRKIIVEVGQKVYFDPFEDVQNANGVDILRGNVTVGTVDYINEKGHWFSVVYGKLRTSFFFHEIGKKVFHDKSLFKRSV
jgi:hypothetical protein